jgi:hypothetical protein
MNTLLALSVPQSIHAFRQLSLDALGLCCSLRVVYSLALAIWGCWPATITAP